MENNSKRGISPEEYELVMDHINNWNPYENVMDHVLRGDIQKGCQYINSYIALRK